MRLLRTRANAATTITTAAAAMARYVVVGNALVGGTTAVDGEGEEVCTGNVGDGEAVSEGAVGIGEIAVGAALGASCTFIAVSANELQ